MKFSIKSLVLTVGFLIASGTFAETPAPGKPAKDSAPASTTVTTTKVNKAPAPMPEKAAKTEKATKAAEGGGANKVWVNTESNVYHCFGSKYYGKTKAGEYMSEAAAKSKGNQPDHGKACKPA